MRILFIGTVEMSAVILERVLELKGDVVGVMTKKESSFNADFKDLFFMAARHNIPCRYVIDINKPENIEWAKRRDPDIIFCFGFSQLLPSELIRCAPMGALGFHPAALPKNRGRHPIVWALALGLEETASTFFFIDSGTDTGDILSQMSIKIDYEDNAQILYDKIKYTALEQISDFLPKLESGRFSRIPQGEGCNYWRKRTKEDGKIDFRKTSRDAYNLVRALSYPYVGAHAFYKDKEVKIWEARERKVDLAPSDCGRVLDLDKGNVLVGCAEGAILFTKHEFKELPKTGEYLL